MKKVLSLVFAAMLCFAMISTVFAADLPFTDVSTSAWYYNDVKTAYEDKLINGKTETTFEPDLNITYVEAIKLAACMHQLYTDGKVTLTVGNPWYQPYVDYCIGNNIIKWNHGLDLGAPATREGYMEIFANALPDKAFEEVNYVPSGSIPDVPDNEAIYKLYRAGIVGGVDAKRNCNPKANIKRSEVAAVLTRMMNEGKRVTFEMPGVEKPEEVVVPLAIKTQPVAVMVNVGETAELKVEVEGGKEPYTYQWQKTVTITKSVTSDFVDEEGKYEGAKTDTFKITLASAGLVEAISCKITDADGASVTTEEVKVTFNEKSTGGIKDKFEQGESEELKNEDFLMYVEDVFTVTGRGTVATGRVIKGKLNTGDTIKIISADGT